LDKSLQTDQSYPRNYYDSTQSSTSINLGTDYSWSITYGDGSVASGPVYRDILNIGALVIENQVVESATTASASFVDLIGDGILVCLIPPFSFHNNPGILSSTHPPFLLELIFSQGMAFGKLNTVKPIQQTTVVDNLISAQDITLQMFTAKLGASINTTPQGKESFYTFGFVDQPTMQDANATDFVWSRVDPSQGF
jgi:hypothetical protein